MQSHYSYESRRPRSNFSRSRSGGGRRRAAPGNQIHPSRFVNKAVAMAEEAPYEPVHQFADFELNAKTQSTLAYLNFVQPSPIQDQTLEPILAGHDLIGLANTGTGKTAAFLLPAIEQLRASQQSVGALILAPTRELAQQIDQEFRRFSAGQQLFSTLVVGGANIARQIQQVKRGPHIIIGTPGRIMDLIGRRVLRLNNVGLFILDEADRMCDMGFSKDIRAIAAELPVERQTLCFSATMTSDVKSIVEAFMRQPVTVSVVRNQTNDHIEQDIVPVPDKGRKLEVLVELLAKAEFEKVLVFGETKHGVQRLADNLTKIGLSAVAIHGNKTQSQRERALQSFKSGNASIMVATDVAARGLDIPDVSHVINFDQPKVYEDYVHRIGRTGRAGKAGKALTFIEQ